MKDNKNRILYQLLAALILTGIVFSSTGLTAFAIAETQAGAADDGSLTAKGVYIVQPRKLKVRSGPGKAYSVTRKLKHGTEVTVLESDSDWWRVSFTGGSGYVNKNCLEPAATAAILTNDADANTYVAKRPIRVRTTPSSKGKVLGKLEKGAEITVIERKGKWRQINYNGELAWIYAKHLKRKK